MLNKLDYSYNCEESIIHRINSVVKLFGLFIYVLLCLLKFNNVLFICNIGFVFLLILLSNINIIKYLKVIWKLKYILIIMYAFMYHKQMDFMNMNIIIFKFVFFVLYLSMIVYTTSREDIGKGTSIVVDRINIVGISFKSITTFFTNILVFVDNFIDSYNEIFIIEGIKGKVYSCSNLIDKIKYIVINFKIVLEDSKEKMNNRKYDMKYRMYNKDVKSKYKYRNKLFIFDYVYVILNVAMLVFYVLKVR